MTLPMDMISWVELWVVSVLPLGLYLASVYYAYALAHKPRMQGDFPWRWSFLWLKLVVVGALIIRSRYLLQLWQAGREGAWLVVDPELLVASWCVGIGLFLHVFLLYKHPVWQEGGPRYHREREEKR